MPGIEPEFLGWASGEPGDVNAGYDNAYVAHRTDRDYLEYRDYVSYGDLYAMCEIKPSKLSKGVLGFWLRACPGLSEDRCLSEF